MVVPPHFFNFSTPSILGKGSIRVLKLYSCFFILGAVLDVKAPAGALCDDMSRLRLSAYTEPWRANSTARKQWAKQEEVRRGYPRWVVVGGKQSSTRGIMRHHLDSRGLYSIVVDAGC